MENQNKIKDIVKQKYHEIATLHNVCPCCTTKDSITNNEYSNIDGYIPEADLKLGCGIPTHYAQIKKGDCVIDLGSGAGNDCFVARSLTSETGKIIGIDFTPSMIEKAQLLAQSLNYNNIEFRLGDLEKIPVDDNTADVVISNCVLNLVPNKKEVFKEIFRILKIGGHFSISDIVLNHPLPDKLKTPIELYAGCIASAIHKYAYIKFILESGFHSTIIQDEKPIHIPNEILSKYLNEQEIDDFNANPSTILSITLYAEKPAPDVN